VNLVKPTLKAARSRIPVTRGHRTSNWHTQRASTLLRSTLALTLGRPPELPMPSVFPFGAQNYLVDDSVWQYAAAQSSGTGFKLFLSFDMTALPCGSSSDAAALRGLLNTYNSHPAQLNYQGKPLVSTFDGENCKFGQDNVNDGWASAVRNNVSPVSLNCSPTGNRRC
jgi:hypothetical protein